MPNPSPSLGWIQKYLKLSEESEVPEDYSFWCGITILAHILGRNVWLDRGFFITYPGQIITILVGPSGSRKTTAVSIACDILRETGNINFLPGKVSAQAFIESLQCGVVGQDGKIIPQDSIGFIKASELSVFLPKQSYVEELIPIITDIFDAKVGPWEYKTMKHGAMQLQSPMVTGLLASTADWLVTNIPQNAYGGGFLARIFFPYSEKSEKSIPFPKITPEMSRLRKELIAELILFKQIKGEFSWTPEAVDYYKDFYKKWQKKEKADSIFEEGYTNRRPEHLVRVAMCLAISQHRSLDLNELDLEAGDLWLQRLESKMLKAFETPESSNIHARYYDRILSFLRKNQTARKVDIQKHVWRYLNATDLAAALHTMTEAGLIETFLAGNGLYYKEAGKILKTN